MNLKKKLKIEFCKKTYWIKFKNNTNCQKWKQYFYVNQKMITIIL